VVAHADQDIGGDEMFAGLVILVILSTSGPLFGLH